jgi:hypothetical protein
MVRPNDSAVNHATYRGYLPMIRNITKPLDARRRKPNVRVKCTSYRSVDDGLLLFFQQLEQLFLGPDVPPDSPIHIIEVPGDMLLFH